MSPSDKPLVWLSEALTTPPISGDTRIQAGYLLRLLQGGATLSLPRSRPMPAIGKRCHELRLNDEDRIWRIFYRTDRDAIVIPHWTVKKTTKTSKADIDLCKTRLHDYDSA